MAKKSASTATVNKKKTSKTPASSPTKNEGYSEPDEMHIIGARMHNLKDIDVSIPRNRFVVITGISGSGKSSLAFDTIYAEGQRRYMETFSAYARQFIGDMERPDVEQITGLSPVISIEQKTVSKNPRSTVGTITEIYDFLRLLYARTGEAYSYTTGKKMVRYNEDQMLAHIFKNFNKKKIVLLAPLVRARKGHYRELFDQIKKQGYTKVRVDGVIMDIKSGMQLDRYKTHDIEAVIDRLAVSKERRDRLNTSLQTALKMGNGFIMVLEHGKEEVQPYSKHLMDPDSGISYEEPSPNAFSFNSPYGACPTCKGLGKVNAVDLKKVIPDDSLSINKSGILPFGAPRENSTFKQLKKIAKKYKFKFSTPVKDIPKEAMDMMLYGGKNGYGVASKYAKHDFTYDLAQEGLFKMLERWFKESTSEKIRNWAEDFMTIDTCSECNGLRLKKESLHFKLNEKNIGELAEMDVAELAAWTDNVGKTFSKRQKEIAKDVVKEIRLRLGFLLHVGLDYLSLNRPARSLSGGEAQRIRLATQIGSQLTGITYILDEPSIGLHQRDNQKLIEALRQLSDIGNTVLVVEHDKDIMLASDYLIDMGPGAGKLGGELVAEGMPKEFMKMNTLTADYLRDKKRIEVPTIEIDQSPIGRTPRSNPATYTGVFTDIRKIFSELPESKIRGYKPGRFSFNVKGGRCETCGGGGKRVIEMNFLPDVEVECEDCMGRRYNRETLEVLYKGKSINDVLNMTVEEAEIFFQPIPNIYRKLKTLKEVGLGYITLGQRATTLSGGEAQRVKLSEELSKRDTGQTIYILDEPTTGLHFDDIRQLLTVLNRLVDKGNTILVIEHNMDVIKVADFIIDMGLEGGHRGGEVVVTGTPEKVAKHKTSHTGRYLKMEL